jgi:hypothetical protein
MPNIATQSNRLSVLGETFDFSGTLNADNVVLTPKDLPAAKAGQLTTRTSNTAGTLTMAGGHGITTAALLDIYWINPDGTYGRRYNVTVGTVATNSVPFSGGLGDNLPLNMTNVTAMVPVVESVAAFLAGIVLAAAKCVGAQATVVFTQDDGTVITALMPNRTPAAAVWYTGLGTSPFTADLGQIHFSHGDSSAERTVTSVVGYN